MMSEKPSDTSTPPPRESLPTLLLDENLSSPDIGSLLRRFPSEWNVELHGDHLARGVSDVAVIEKCGANGWVLISCDDRIRYVPENKAAVNRCCVRVFMFGKGNYQGVEYAAAMIVGRGQILNAIRKTAGPCLARIQRTGDVVMLEPQESTTGISSQARTAKKYGAHVLKQNTEG